MSVLLNEMSRKCFEHLHARWPREHLTQSSVQDLSNHVEHPARHRDHRAFIRPAVVRTDIRSNISLLEEGTMCPSRRWEVIGVFLPVFEFCFIFSIEEQPPSPAVILFAVLGKEVPSIEVERPFRCCFGKVQVFFCLG